VLTLRIRTERPVNFDWLVLGKSLFWGDVEAFLQWDEVDKLPVDPPAAAILTCEIVKYRQIACLNAFLSGELQVRGVLVKASRHSIARKLSSPERGNVRSRTFGVITDYYTCHVPVDEPGVKSVYRYCLGLRQGGGIKARVKQTIKAMLIAFGFGYVLCEYFLVYFERI
jgi:hypothetical protein